LQSERESGSGRKAVVDEAWVRILATFTGYPKVNELGFIEGIFTRVCCSGWGSSQPWRLNV
jgi:hypothetical protein